MADFSAGVPAREFLNWGAAMKEMPIIFLEPGDPVPVMVLCDPCGLGNIRLRGSLSGKLQPGVCEGPAKVFHRPSGALLVVPKKSVFLG